MTRPKPETVPFHEANLPWSAAHLIDGAVCELPRGRRVEVWRVEGDRDNLCIRIYQPTADGKVSELTLGISKLAAAALADGITEQLKQK